MFQCCSTTQSGTAQRIGENIVPKFYLRKRKKESIIKKIPDSVDQSNILLQVETPLSMIVSGLGFGVGSTMTPYFYKGANTHRTYP